jgi:ADP-ribose pyrophosphatase YjhB (NUDIX family)
MEKIKAYGVCLYKIKKNSIKILLCKSIKSKNKWGFLKGAKESNETKQQTAQREFEEESSIYIDIDDFEQYFEQKNEFKDIGIFLVDAKKVKNIDIYFIDDTLIDYYLSWENQEVRFFDISTLPLFKEKQSKLILQICNLLRHKL